MRIVAVSVLEYSRQLDGRSWNPSFRWTERRVPLVLIEADNGHIGVGEAWCRQTTIGTVLVHLSDVVAPRLPGLEVVGPESIAGIAAPMHTIAATGSEPWIAAAAASAIDMALWDLLGRSRGQPLWRALGGQSNRVNVYASGGLYRDGDGVDELAAEMRSYVAAGFRAVKMKIGALPLAADLERVRAVRSAIGSEILLWTDAVNQLDRDTAIPWAGAMADAGAAAIQAPVPFSDLETMIRINRECLPVIAGEAEHDLAGFEELLASHAVTLVQPCLGLCGGLSGAGAIASRARALAIGTTVQTFGTAVMQAASLHWGAATTGVLSVEYHRFHDHLAPLLGASLARIMEGGVALSEEPGLGISLPRPGPQTDGGEIRCHRHVIL